VAHAPEIWHKANFSDAKPLGSPSVDFSAGKIVSMCFGEMELLESVSRFHMIQFISLTGGRSSSPRWSVAESILPDSPGRYRRSEIPRTRV
jgi:hypothetical protein